MKLKSYNILFRMFSYLSDKTNGAPFFVRYKLLLGTLILGLVSSMSAKAQKKEVVNDTILPPTSNLKNIATSSEICKSSKISEDIEVRGQVIDEHRDYLPGVSIIIKGTTIGVVSDIDGNFRIKAKTDDKLVFAYVGMETKEMPVSAMRNGKAIITMEDSHMILCYEVVIVQAPFRDDIYSRRAQAPKKIKELSYTEVSTPPVSIVGDLSDFEKWVQKNIVYSETMKEEKVQGEVILRFAIDKKGNLVDKKVIGKLSKEADKEVLRLLSHLGKWTPGIYDGEPIKTTMTIKVNFDYNNP